MTYVFRPNNKKLAQMKENIKLFPNFADSVYYKEGKWKKSICYNRGNDRREVSTKILFFGAVEYPESKSAFLAGPHHIAGKDFGFFTLEVSKNVHSVEELRTIYADEENPKGMDSTLYMPYLARQRVHDYFGEASDFLSDRKTFESYSDLDIKYGKDEIPSDFKPSLKEGEKPTQCGLFFRTKGALNKVLECLTSAEIDEWKQNLIKSNLSILNEIIVCGATAEKPYKVFLFGNDDASWSLAFATEDEAVEFITNELPKGYEAISKHMRFTN